jgi:hypothetical protein
MTIPTKTPLGHDELKSRTLKLGQRHRTILFLVDGRRPLAEVLSLAHQAGAATSHFEELVKLGLVDVQADEPPAVPSSAAPDPEVAEVREVALDAPQAGPLAAAAPLQQSPPAALSDEGVDAVDEVEERPEFDAVVEPAPAAPVAPVAEMSEVAPSALVEIADADPWPCVEPAADASDQRLPRVEPAPAEPEPLPAEPGREPEPRFVAPAEARGGGASALPSLEDVVAPVVLPPVPTVLPPVLPAVLPRPQPKARARRAPKVLPVLGEDSAVDPLQQIRDLLVDTLRFDAPLFSARMFMRVRNAQTTSELIDLVWEIQEHLARARHAQRELRSLQRARELLGLGNTLVAEDSTRPPMDD